MNDLAGELAQAPAADEIFEHVYVRLKAMAGKQLTRGQGDTINTTALVHELYLRMSSGEAKRFVDPSQFFDYAAKAMRHILIDRARARMRDKRGGGDVARVDLDDDDVSQVEVTASRAIEVDSALRLLAVHAPRAARIVELHFFGGLPLDQVAKWMGISVRTVNREWRFARACLHGGML